MSPNPIKAVKTIRALGADTQEEFEAFREAIRERHAIKQAVEMAFIAKGWTVSK